MKIQAMVAGFILVVAGCSSLSDTSGGTGGPPNLPGDGGDQEYDSRGGPPIPENPDCVDIDGDGFGDGCVQGPDCDETNPKLNTYCPPCDNGIYEGCPCLNDGSSIACYSGDPAFLGIGACQAGQQDCVGGYWTACTGSVEPSLEFCDYQDNDCDGDIDEGVLSPCGDCNEKCVNMGAGPDGEEVFELEGNNHSGVDLNVDGHIVLDSEKVNMHFIWIANSAENTVSKIDTETGKEQGRYNVCSNPSRTAVDLYGDVWVGCRNDGGIAKIQAYKAKCVDKDGDGEIETSEDANGNGVIESGEMLGQGKDECMKFVVHPGGGCQRAVGVDKDNHAWVGDWDGKKLRRLEPAGGETVQTISIPANPYGLVIDQNGIIWVSGRGGNKLVRVDPSNDDVKAFESNLGCYEPYGITLDHKGRVWTANCCCWAVAYRYDPSNGAWAYATTKDRPRGIVGSMDGYIYVANDESDKVAVVDADSMDTLGYVSLGNGRYPLGMTIDFSGYVWAVNQNQSSPTKIDPHSWNIVGEYPTGSGPYTYSDMTGYLLHTFTNPTGFYQHLFGGWGLRLVWTAIIIDAYVPAGTYIKVRLRAAPDDVMLKTTAWSDYFGPFPPQSFPLDITGLNLMGAYMEVEVSLYTEVDGLTPIVKAIEVKFEAGEGDL